MACMEAVLAVPAVVIVATAVFQVRRARAPHTIVDLTTPPAPPVDLDFLQARVPESEHAALMPISGEVCLGARLLAADRRSGTNGNAPVVVHRRRRGEPLVARR